MFILGNDAGTVQVRKHSPALFFSSFSRKHLRFVPFHRYRILHSSSRLCCRRSLIILRTRGASTVSSTPYPFNSRVPTESFEGDLDARLAFTSNSLANYFNHMLQAVREDDKYSLEKLARSWQYVHSPNTANVVTGKAPIEGS